jgi:tetratricopeptide (TPR) repeat protein
MLGVVKKPKGNKMVSNMDQMNSQIVYYVKDDPTNDELMFEDKNSSGYWVNKGEDLWRNSNGTTEDAKAALSYFDRAIELNPLNYIAWMNKGLIFKKLNMQEEAVMCYDKAIQIKPTYPTSWINKGVLLGCIGKIREAIECFDKVLEIAPGNELALRDKKMLNRILKQRQCSKIIVKTVKDAVNS